MAKIDQLKQEVVDLKAGQVKLQATVDAEQEQIQKLLDAFTETIAGLNAQIEALKAQLADVGSPEDIQAVIDSLEEIKTSMEATAADVESTVSDGTTSTSSSTTETTTEGDTTTSSTTETTSETTTETTTVAESFVARTRR